MLNKQTNLPRIISRINALESSLQHFSRTSNFYSYPSCTLKDAAARVIQTHFRAFLVHRSRTLRQLKDLAFIKSSLNSLKRSISNKTHFDCEAVSQKTMDLLLKLESFQVYLYWVLLKISVGYLFSLLF